jgi:hypothetical protein
MSYVDRCAALIRCAYVSTSCLGYLLRAVESCSQGYEELASCDFSLSPGALINLTASGVAMSDGRFDPS